MTLVDRSSSCILGWAVESHREQETLQAMVDKAPQATYRKLIYTPRIYTPIPGKSETYRVEGDKAEMRHYLARLARRSRCFSRCIDALRRAIKLFVYAWNARQLYRQRFPDYPAHLIQFL